MLADERHRPRARTPVTSDARLTPSVAATRGARSRPSRGRGEERRAIAAARAARPRWRRRPRGCSGEAGVLHARPPRRRRRGRAPSALPPMPGRADQERVHLAAAGGVGAPCARRSPPRAPPSAASRRAIPRTRACWPSEHLRFGLEQPDQLRHGVRAFADDPPARALRRQRDRLDRRGGPRRAAPASPRAASSWRP